MAFNPASSKGLVAGLAAGALWGLVFVAPRVAVGFAAVDVMVLRYLTYGLVSLLWLLGSRWWQGPQHRWPTWAQAGSALYLSLLGCTGYYFFLVLAIRDMGAQVPTLIIGTIPLWMMLLGKPQGLRWRALVPGLLLTLGGLGLMMLASAGLLAAHPSAPHYARGVAWALAAMLSWTAFGLLNAQWLKRHPDVDATDWANWLGIATGLGALALAAGFGSNLSTLRALPAWWPGLLVCVLTGVGSAWLATILWNMASRHLSASLCGQLIVSETLFALLYTFAWDQVWPSPLELLAALLFTLGIVASIRAHR